jgi:hypothetical protein
VYLNVTAVSPSGSGFVTVFPCGQDQPNASNLNFTAGQIVPNAVFAKLGAFGQVCLFTSVSTDLLVDVNGYAVPGGPISVAPARLLDTRPGYTTVDGAAVGIGRIPGGTAIWLAIAGRGGVPSNAVAVLLNITAVSGSGDGYVTVYPCDTNPPNASNLNFTAGEIVPNAVFAKLGTNGRVCLYVQTTVDLVVDVNGYATQYYENRWSNPQAGGWTYDGDQDGRAEEAWLDKDLDNVFDAAGFDLDDDGDFEWVAVDSFGSNLFDTWLDDSRTQARLLYFDLNEDDRYELVFYDANRDDYGEVALADNDENGLFEAGIGDANGDGVFEQYLRDTNGDGTADTWIAAQGPTSTLPQQQPALTGFYRTFAADTVTYNPVYAGGVSAFGNWLTAAAPIFVW